MASHKSIALLAGTGLASKLNLFLEKPERLDNVDVRFGDRRGRVLCYYRSSYEGLEVVVLPRHGPSLSIPDRGPAELVRQNGHEAHIWHLYELGVSAIYSFNSVGALDRSVPLAADNGFLIPDACARGIGAVSHSFEDQALVIHPSMAEPFDPILRGRLDQAVGLAGAYAVTTGTYINSLGDIFESPTEVLAYRRLYEGALNRVVGMTCLPELMLAKQMNIPYAAICANCNWAEGLEPGEPVTHEHVHRGMAPAAAALQEIARQLVMIEAGSLQLQSVLA